MNRLFSIVVLIAGMNFVATACMSGSSEQPGSAGASSVATAVERVYFDNEKKDVARIEGIMKKVGDIPDINDRVVAIAREFIGTPYVGHTLEIPEEETLYVSTSGLDCLTFVETVISIAKTSGSDHPDMETYLTTLRSIRYRDGEIDGYPSRLHYASEWAADNEKRGNFREITPDYDLSEKRVKTIDFMTKNRRLYPAMKDDAVYKAIKENEKALRGMEYSIIPTAKVDMAAKNFLKNGDVVAIVTDKAGLDVSHNGIIIIKDGIPHLIHASSKFKKVISDTTPLKEYLQKQGSPGIRVFRL